MTYRTRNSVVAAVAVLVSLVSVAALAAIPGTDVVIPVVARIQGLGTPASQYYTTLWLSNQSSTDSVSVLLELYQRDAATNPTATATVTLAPGETQRIDNCVEQLFGLQTAAGSLRVRATEQVLASTRTYNLPPGGTEKDTTGQYFAAAPVSFAIGLGQATRVQGVSQDGESRSNFGVVEVAGAPVTVHVVLKNALGVVIAAKDYPLPAHGQMQKPVTDVSGAVTGDSNAVLEASVTAGDGKILAYGTQNTNVSQDGTGFEMAYPENWVTSLNAARGDITLQAGENVRITSGASAQGLAASGGSGAQTITISAPGAVGPSGPTGPAGLQGSAGPAGPTGARGLTGAAGPIGPMGLTGATGAVGTTGPIGPQGLTWQQEWAAGTTYARNDAVGRLGSSYISLADANVGNPPETSPAQWSLVAQAGAAGPIGPTGAAGLAGPAGPTGATGLAGPQGVAGATGAVGLAGPAGPTGATGLAGPQGVAGATGAVGFAGPAGPTGATGVAGPQGVAGATGAVGFAGPAGPTGATGVAGPQGAAGATGAVGFAGPAGPTGATGVAGPQGAAGATGATGATGGGISAYGHIYNLSTEVVPIAAAIVFDSNGPLLGITHVPGTSSIVIANAGTYQVTFTVSAVEANQFALFVNGLAVPGAVFGSGAGTQQNNGRAIVALAAGDVVTVTNFGSVSAVTLQTLAGGTAANVNAAVTILKLD